jgi:hypothetical protein
MNAQDMSRRQAEPERARDKPQCDRAEHANLERRSGAHAHPRAQPRLGLRTSFAQTRCNSGERGA